MSQTFTKISCPECGAFDVCTRWDDADIEIWSSSDDRSSMLASTVPINVCMTCDFEFVDDSVSVRVEGIFQRWLDDRRRRGIIGLALQSDPQVNEKINQGYPSPEFPSDPGMTLELKKHAKRLNENLNPSFVLETISLVATLVLNIFDAMLTISGYQKGILLELNPLLAPLVGTPVLFFLAKMSLVVAGLGILWKLRFHAWTQLASLGLFVVYSGVVTYHLYGLLALCN